MLSANDANPQNGAFAQYIAVKGDVQMHIPDNVSFEAAATAGCGIGTVGYALYGPMGLNLPIPSPDGGIPTEEKDKPLLISGGSSATGTLAIQFAKL